ncbi:dihydroneopterin aldolase [Corallococcus macrosporus]|uniref:dihydroneopterin aldolase n=2 Tax=Corallococcus macrosporus TaxID=35 RepID=A0ABS3DHH3_9BACT|nr:dihydroneopterin aldolase [Corallococcus macrosporus]MBN8230773.1 dihydroneopterin aldolase [Corallococcus macrosporus]
MELRGLTVDVIVGVYNRERVTPQPLRLDVALFLDARQAAVGGRLANTVHYGRLAGELRFLLDACRFELLESAAEAVCRYLLAPPTDAAPHAHLYAATVRVTKPEALTGWAIPSLQVHRTSEEMVYRTEAKDFGHVDVIHEGATYGVYRLRVAPGRGIPPRADGHTEGMELVLGAGMLLRGQPVGRGLAFPGPGVFGHRYDNPTATEQTVLGVYRPRLVLSEEEAVGSAEPLEPGTLYYLPE